REPPWVRFVRTSVGQYAILPPPRAIGFDRGQAPFDAMTTSLDMPIVAESTEITTRAEAVGAAIQESPPQWPRSWPLKLWYGLCYVLEWLFGLASLLACLAVLAAIPIRTLLSMRCLL